MEDLSSLVSIGKWFLFIEFLNLFIQIKNYLHMKKRDEDVFEFNLKWMSYQKEKDFEREKEEKKKYTEDRNDMHILQSYLKKRSKVD